METDKSYLLLGIIGKPVLHSRSPEMHNAALAACDITGRYLRIASPNAHRAALLCRDLCIQGINVTAPFKEEAFMLCDEADPLSSKLSAANTLVFKEQILGFNTDVQGVAQALSTNKVPCSNVNAIVIGAGAAARAAICALSEEKANITVLNRTFHKAKALAEEFHCNAISLNDEKVPACISQSSIIISCVSTDEAFLPSGFLSPKHHVFDAVYKRQTALVKEAMNAGAHIIAGLDWLLFQGASAFEHFTGRPAPVEAMRDALLAPLSWRGKKSIALIGMMGSGKSVVGETLASKLKLPIFDLDIEIERRAGKSIRELIENKGEEEFRILESKVLKDFSSKPEIVLSCGGGVILSEENRALLQEKFLCIWLWSPISELAARIGNGTQRPLLTGFELKARLQELLEKRRNFYAEVSDLLVDSSEMSSEEVAEGIYYEICAAGIFAG